MDVIRPMVASNTSTKKICAHLNALFPQVDLDVRRLTLLVLSRLSFGINVYLYRNACHIAYKRVPYRNNISYRFSLDADAIKEGVQQLVERGGKDMGRAQTLNFRMEFGGNVSSRKVMEALREVDPEGVQVRRYKILRRTEYQTNET